MVALERTPQALMADVGCNCQLWLASHLCVVRFIGHCGSCPASSGATGYATTLVLFLAGILYLWTYRALVNILFKLQEHVTLDISCMPGKASVSSRVGRGQLA